MKFAQHPMYAVEDAARQATQWQMDQGHTVFQLFQFGDSEAEHAAELLRLAGPPMGGNVLSLGCGIGGIERLWQIARPDLEFELVNLCAPQLEMCLCSGRKVLADADGYASDAGPFDVVLMAYMLGHVDPVPTVYAAMQNLKPDGTLLIADVFDSYPVFDEALLYASPRMREVLLLADTNSFHALVVSEGLAPTPYVAKALGEDIGSKTAPAVIVLKRLK